MENQLNKYIGQELKESIESLQVKTGVTKDGSSYNYISLKLKNGYETRIFAKQGEQFAYSNAFELLTASRQIENNF